MKLMQVLGMQKLQDFDHSTSAKALDKYAEILESHFPRAVQPYPLADFIVK